MGVAALLRAVEFKKRIELAHDDNERWKEGSFQAPLCVFMPTLSIGLDRVGESFRLVHVVDLTLAGTFCQLVTRQM